MKLCKDCKWIRLNMEFYYGFFKKRPTKHSFEFAKCAHPDNASPVDGSALRHCSTMRDFACKDAKFWEPKE